MNKSGDKLAQKLTDAINAWFTNWYEVINVDSGSTVDGYSNELIEFKWYISIKDAKEGWDWTDKLESSIKTKIIVELQKSGINLHDGVYMRELPIILFDQAAYKKKKFGFYGWLEVFVKV